MVLGLLFVVLLDPVHRLGQVGLRDYIIPAVDRVGFVARKCHPLVLRQAGAPEVADGRAPHVVRQEPRHVERLRRSPKRLLERPDRFAVAVEHILAVEPPDLQPPRSHPSAPDLECSLRHRTYCLLDPK